MKIVLVIVTEEADAGGPASATVGCLRTSTTRRHHLLW